MIAVDWGTSSLRLYRLDAGGMVLERRRSDEGVLASAGRFGEVLARGIQGWDDPVIMLCGMVGGRAGMDPVMRGVDDDSPDRDSVDHAGR